VVPADAVRDSNSSCRVSYDEERGKNRVGLGSNIEIWLTDALMLNMWSGVKVTDQLRIWRQRLEFEQIT